MCLCVEAAVARQPHGPYNLLGWRQSTVLALEVQRQLEARASAAVCFLVHGDVVLVQRWAQAARAERHSEAQDGDQVSWAGLGTHSDN